MNYPDKYRGLLDTEVWSFIEQTEACYPPDATQLTVAEQRSIYDDLCRRFFARYPHGVTAINDHIDTKSHSIPIRRYSCSADKAQAEVIYFHGGGFVVGGLESHDDVCAEICAKTGFSVTSIDYRLAPENVFPADFDDAVTAYTHVANSTDLPIILVGDSAGGNLAASVCHAVRGEDRRPAGQVLIYPGLGSDLTRQSFIEHADAPMLTTKDCEFYVDLRTGGDKKALSDKRCFPLEDDDFSNLPPTVVIAAQCDPLCDDGRDYSSTLLEFGNKATFIEETGLVHGYLRARHSVTKAKVSFEKILQNIRLLGTRQWVDEAAES